MAEAWFQDDREIDSLAARARSIAAERPAEARALRRDALTRALTQRPLLGQPWRLPDLVPEDSGGTTLREVVEDLIWSLERQADALLARDGEEARAFALDPADDAGAWDAELEVRELEIARLRDGQEQLRRQLRETEAALGASKGRATALERRLGEYERHLGRLAARERETRSNRVLSGWRALAPRSLREALWRRAPATAARLRRLALLRERHRH